ncbi:hypothetical protein [Parafrankia sp. BMG5.11]|uniref:hypothetical protein n=1 Tax=Parafrankia sp. BMG5.11 TaxID=222540 RepID=UPI00103FDC2A|nr:hypothetical protein [Parafrankia sp. BMG5.11]TCJ39580.1 hypothetical protein E0504_10805 [Parafrankia sp. BMG5.11]
MTADFSRYANSYSSAKSGLGQVLGLSDDLLHVHLGLAIFVAAALLTRRRMRSWIPLAIVTILAVANEVIDYYGPDPWNDGLSALDLANTMVWPLVLFLLARRGKTGPVKV